MEMVDLDSEFQSKSKELRAKVIDKAIPKRMNGKELSGEMIVILAKSFIEAMNSGKVPNIDSSWTNMCKTECLKVMKVAEALF
jgi:hypothetical protein